MPRLAIKHLPPGTQPFSRVAVHGPHDIFPQFLVLFVVEVWAALGIAFIVHLAVDAEEINRVIAQTVRQVDRCHAGVSSMHPLGY